MDSAGLKGLIYRSMVIVNQVFIFKYKLNNNNNNSNNAVSLVHERSIPTERPPLISEVSANAFQIEGVA
jgi:hypothetical protein